MVRKLTSSGKSSDKLHSCPEIFDPLPQPPRGPAWEIYCSYVSAAKRREIWEAAHGPVPEGMRIGWTCSVAYCAKLHHMRLDLDKTHGRFNYKPIREKLEGLKDGEYVDVPTIENVARFRSGLISGTMLRVSVRALPEGGVRVIRVGMWPRPLHLRVDLRERIKRIVIEINGGVFPTNDDFFGAAQVLWAPLLDPEVGQDASKIAALLDLDVGKISEWVMHLRENEIWGDGRFCYGLAFDRIYNDPLRVRKKTWARFRVEFTMMTFCAIGEAQRSPAKGEYEEDSYRFVTFGKRGAA